MLIIVSSAVEPTDFLNQAPATFASAFLALPPQTDTFRLSVHDHNQPRAHARELDNSSSSKNGLGGAFNGA